VYGPKTTPDRNRKATVAAKAVKAAVAARILAAADPGRRVAAAHRIPLLPAAVSIQSQEAEPLHASDVADRRRRTTA
jgi:hypothetical protein